MDADLAAEVQRIGTDAGLDAVGVAPAEPFVDTRRHLEERKAAGLHGGMQFTYRNPARSTDPTRALRGARSLVVGARRYLQADPTAPTDGPPRGRVARYSWRDHYEPLRESLKVVANYLEGRGFHALVLADDNALVDRQAAYQAGLGWYGKNTNLLLPGRGSWFVLGAVITDAPLADSARPLEDGCGSCRRCLPACPTGALIAPGVLDARRCLAWLVQAPGVFPAEYRVALGDRMYGCDECQEVCPVNLRAAQSDPPPPAPADDQPTVDLLELLAASDEFLLDRYGRWYIPQRQPRYLRRNALIVLGNTASGTDPAVGQTLAGALANADPLIRAHAVWAAARLGREDLLAAVEGDPDEMVQAELAALPAPR
jgi:epoxyqueuosine reductase